MGRKKLNIQKRTNYFIKNNLETLSKFFQSFYDSSREEKYTIQIIYKKQTNILNQKWYKFNLEE